MLTWVRSLLGCRRPVVREQWWYVDGHPFDFTSVVDAHPGGSAILLGRGQECRELIASYHLRMPDDFIWKLKRNPSYRVKGHTYPEWSGLFPDPEDDLPYYALRQDVRVALAGSGHKCTRGAAALALGTVGAWAWCMLGCGGVPAKLLAGVLAVGIAFQLLHTAGHSGMSGSSQLNAVAYWFGCAVFGWGPDQWLTHHNLLHHVHTGGRLDPDARRHKMLRNLPPGLPSFVFYNTVPHLGQVVTYLATQSASYMFNWTPVARVHGFPRVAAALFAATVWVSTQTWAEAAAYLTSVALGYYGNICYNHDQLKVHRNKRDSYASWADRQVTESGNVRFSPPLEDFLGGINRQIEHHLFPSVHPVHYRRVAPLVRSWAASRGVLYVEDTYAGALAGYWELYRTRLAQR